MKTIFIVSEKADFSASRLMTESALMSHGYICCETYDVYDVTGRKNLYLGKMDASEVIHHIKQDGNSYLIKEVPGKNKEETIVRFSDKPKIFYVSARPLYE